MSPLRDEQRIKELTEQADSLEESIRESLDDADRRATGPGT